MKRASAKASTKNRSAIKKNLVAWRMSHPSGDAQAATHQRAKTWDLAEDRLEQQEARALELEELGDLVRAVQVRHCGKYHVESVRQRGDYGDGSTRSRLREVLVRGACRTRECPKCAGAAAQKRQGVVHGILMRMSNPEHVVISMTSRGRYDLGETITQFRVLLRLLRKQPCCRNVVCAVGGLETKLRRDGHGWNVHAHLIIDAPRLKKLAMRKAWQVLLDASHAQDVAESPRGGKLRKRLGSVKCEQAIRNLKAISIYITKARDVCPSPGTMALKDYALLREGIKRRQLLVEWNTHRRGRKVVCDRFQVRDRKRRAGAAWPAPRPMSAAQFSANRIRAERRAIFESIRV